MKYRRASGDRVRKAMRGLAKERGKDVVDELLLLPTFAAAVIAHHAGLIRLQDNDLKYVLEVILS